MARNVIRSNGDVEFDVLSEMDMEKFDVDPRKSDVASHVSICLRGFFFQIHVRKDVPRNIDVFLKTSQADMEMSGLMSTIMLPGF